MIANKKEFFIGAGMLLGFIIVLALMFSPILHGRNALENLDDLYNSISKGSAYYIPDVQKEIEPAQGKTVSVKITMSDDKQAQQTALLFKAAGAQTAVDDKELKVSGDLGQILSYCLTDADAMYHNDAEKIKSKYNYDERQVLFNWWSGLKQMDKDLTRQGKFDEAKFIDGVQKKAVETSYNYYTIEPQKIKERWGVVLFSLVFYVVYTVWYGFSILFMMEGLGLKLE